jgi:hypothetical protein
MTRALIASTFDTHLSRLGESTLSNDENKKGDPTLIGELPEAR